MWPLKQRADVHHGGCSGAAQGGLRRVLFTTITSATTFNGFGGHYLAASASPNCERHSLDGDLASTRKLVRRCCPRLPGVYGMIDAAGQLIYVGKSKQLRSRLLSYCSAGEHEKSHRILARAAVLVWETAPASLPPCCANLN